MKEPRLLHIDRAALVMRVPERWLRAEAEAGRIPHVNADGRLLFNVAAVMEVLAERATREGLSDGSKGRTHA